MKRASADTDVEATITGLGEVLSNGELDAAAACFARDGCLRTPDGTLVHGRIRIRETLAQVIAMSEGVDLQIGSLVLGGPVAVGRGLWRMRSRNPQNHVRESQFTLILSPMEGVWKIAIAFPWETAA